MFARVLFLLAPVWFASCALLPSGEEKSFNRLAGTWNFSHVTLESLPDVAQTATSMLEGGQIVIRKDGTAVFKFLGSSNETTLLFKSDSKTQTVFALADNGDLLVYDKGTQLLRKSTSIDIDGAQGKMPIYFKKAAEVE